MQAMLEKVDTKELLKKADLKVTPQRILILEVIRKSGHATIEYIYSEVKKQYPSISIATVYKNIHNLYEKGVLKEIKPRNDKAFYELAISTHSHFICINCNTIYDVEPCSDVILSKCAVDVPGKALESELNIYGICENCKDS